MTSPALVHDDPQRITSVQDAGWVLRLETVIRWRNLLDEIVVAMDAVLSSTLSELFGIIRWKEGEGHA